MHANKCDVVTVIVVVVVQYTFEQRRCLSLCCYPRIDNFLCNLICSSRLLSYYHHHLFTSNLHDISRSLHPFTHFLFVLFVEDSVELFVETLSKCEQFIDVLASVSLKFKYIDNCSIVSSSIHFCG